MCRLSWNLGASTSWKPHGLSRSVEGFLYHNLYLYPCYTYSYLLVTYIIHHVLQTSHVLTPSFICYYNWNIQNISQFLTTSTPTIARAHDPLPAQNIGLFQGFCIKAIGFLALVWVHKIWTNLFIKNDCSNKVDLLHNQWRTQEFCSVGGVSTNSVEDRGQGSGGCNPLVRGSGGSCNLVKEISFHTVKSSFFWYFNLLGPELFF